MHNELPNFFWRYEMKIGINGFGRIGRTIAKINEIQQRFELIGINDINDHVDNMAYLFKYDSTHGKFPGTVASSENSITINSNMIPYTSFRDIDQVPWKEWGVDIIIDSSGIGQNVERVREVIRSGGAKKAIVTHSSSLVDREVIMGVNDDTITEDDAVVSNSICDANAISHFMKWIDEEYGIESGSVTTLHPWLSYQNLVDGPAISQANPGVVWTDYALGRGSPGGLIPKETTAMDATERVLPHLKGKILSFSYRVPTGIVASADMTLQPKKVPSQKALEEYLKRKIDGSLYVSANYESLTSIDYEKEEYSAVCDMQWLKVENGMIKIILWYDNEWGYSCRVVDLIARLEQLIPSKTEKKMAEIII